MVRRQRSFALAGAHPRLVVEWTDAAGVLVRRGNLPALLLASGLAVLGVALSVLSAILSMPEASVGIVGLLFRVGLAYALVSAIPSFVLGRRSVARGRVDPQNPFSAPGA